MKRTNPWISISDLMSGTVLILLMMFILAAVLPQYTQEARKREMMIRIGATLREYQNRGQVQIHLDTGILEFTSVTFAFGSAELSNSARDAIKDFSSQLKVYMLENPKMEILIEGHTDPANITTVVNRGGYFENNVQLSTLRAANVRNEVLNNIGWEYAHRIGVAGYGETRLKNTDNPLSAENRRIEIRFLWKGQDEN